MGLACIWGKVTGLASDQAGPPSWQVNARCEGLEVGSPDTDQGSGPFPACPLLGQGWRWAVVCAALDWLQTGGQRSAAASPGAISRRAALGTLVLHWRGWEYPSSVPRRGACPPTRTTQTFRLPVSLPGACERGPDGRPAPRPRPAATRWEGTGSRAPRGAPGRGVCWVHVEGSPRRVPGDPASR